MRDQEQEMCVYLVDCVCRPQRVCVCDRYERQACVCDTSLEITANTDSTSEMYGLRQSLPVHVCARVSVCTRSRVM